MRDFAMRRRQLLVRKPSENLRLLSRPLLVTLPLESTSTSGPAHSHLNQHLTVMFAADAWKNLFGLMDGGVEKDVLKIC